jgi:hypothetical protein
MNIISFLRQARIGGIAIFDVALSYLGIYLLSPILSNIAKSLGLRIKRSSWLWLTIPIGVIVHILFKQSTTLNNLLFTNGNYPIKLLLVFMLFMGIKDVRKVN